MQSIQCLGKQKLLRSINQSTNYHYFILEILQHCLASDSAFDLHMRRSQQELRVRTHNEHITGIIPKCELKSNQMGQGHITLYDDGMLRGHHR